MYNLGLDLSTQMLWPAWIMLCRTAESCQAISLFWTTHKE